MRKQYENNNYDCCYTYRGPGNFVCAPKVEMDEVITIIRSSCKATPDNLYVFNEEEIAKAGVIAYQYLEGLRTESIGALEYSKIRYDPGDPERECYGTELNIDSKNIIVFRADLNVIHEWDGFDANKYDDWSIIITRKDKDSNWEFKDAGY